MNIFSREQQATYKIVNSIDWKNHQLGEISSWPAVLTYSLNFILNSKQPCFLFWGEDAYCFYNDGYIPILGEDKHPASMGQPANNVWPEIWDIDTNPQFQMAMKGEATWNVDRMVPIMRKGKIQEAYFTYGYSPIYLDDGSINGVLVTAVETTDKVISKNILIKREEQLKLAVEVTKIGFYDWDIVNDLVVFNPQMQLDWGIKAGTKLSGVIEYIHPEDRQRVSEDIALALESHQDYKSVYRVVKPTGDMWVEARGKVQYVDGKPTRFFGTSVDVSEQVEARLTIEKAANDLASERQKLEDMINVSTTGIALLRGPEGIFEIANGGFKELVSERSYIGKTWQEAYPELTDSPLPGILKEVFETGESFSAFEMLINVEVSPGVMKDQFYDFSYDLTYDGEGKPYGVFIQCSNVTDKVTARFKLEDAVIGLESERDLRERFVDALSHDLRTPLTAAKLSAQLLGRRQHDSAQILKSSNRIVYNMDRADTMIRDLLDASRFKAGETIPLEMNECDLKKLAEETVVDLSHLHGERFKLILDEGIQGYWDCDALKRILENLVNNAVKYGAPSGPITIFGKNQNQKVEIGVHNEGPHLSSEDQELIFKPFKRTQSAHSGSKHGWGIGLTLVRGFAEAHGGLAKVNSSSEHGTTFSIVIPKDSRNLNA